MLGARQSLAEERHQFESDALGIIGERPVAAVLQDYNARAGEDVGLALGEAPDR